MLESCKKDINPFFKRGAILFLFLFLINSVSAYPTVTMGNYVFDNKVVILGDTSLYCSLTGCTMEGDINMDNYSIIHANWINATYTNISINHTQVSDPIWVETGGDTMTGDLIVPNVYGDLYGSWNGSIDYYTVDQIDQNFTDFVAGIVTYNDSWINITTNASILYMIQNLTTNGTPAEYDGGFANSVYLASQLIDGGTA